MKQVDVPPVDLSLDESCHFVSFFEESSRFTSVLENICKVVETGAKWESQQDADMLWISLTV